MNKSNLNLSNNMQGSNAFNNLSSMNTNNNGSSNLNLFKPGN